MLKTISLAALTASFCVVPAAADEVMNLYLASTGEYLNEIYYEDDVDQYAVWASSDGKYRMYFDGMANVWTERGSYSGYWVDYVESYACPAGAAEDHLGNQVVNWGYLQVDWHTDSTYTVYVGECDGPMDMTITGQQIR